MFSSVDILVIIAGYIIGCFSTGYYLVRLRTGQDIRRLGSGSVGARNVGRVLGRSGFLITLCADMAKGVLAVGMARFLGLRTAIVMLTLIAVVIGHVWPVQLGFQGGKGVATVLGGLMIYDPMIAGGVLLIFLCVVALQRGDIVSGSARPPTTLHVVGSATALQAGLITMTVAPFVLLVLKQSLVTVIGLFALDAILLFAHRKNIRDMISRLKVKRESPH